MRVFSAVALVVAVAACSDGQAGSALPTEAPAFKASASTQQEWLPFNAVTGSCSGEAVVWEGTVHVVFHVTEDGAGGLHIGGQANFQNTAGTGQDSGLRYRLVGRSVRGFDGTLNFTPGGAIVDHFVIHQQWIAQGNADDLVFHGNVLIVFNANGEPTAVKNDPAAPGTCKG